ncbi:hypothetical protein HDR58_03275 [bacterium]|nr:hypothetical protein [bacterium]
MCDQEKKGQKKQKEQKEQKWSWDSVTSLFNIALTLITALQSFKNNGISQRNFNISVLISMLLAVSMISLCLHIYFKERKTYKSNLDN